MQELKKIAINTAKDEVSRFEGAITSFADKEHRKSKNVLNLLEAKNKKMIRNTIDLLRKEASTAV